MQPQSTTLPDLPCPVEGCDSPRNVATSSLGKRFYQKYCRAHHANNASVAWSRKLGRPIQLQSYLDIGGYRQVRHEGRYIPEHRLVMSQVLGRPLRKGESVHHINGIRDDNRPENLELWVGPIRSGQRARDVICPHCSKPYLDA